MGMRGKNGKLIKKVHDIYMALKVYFIFYLRSWWYIGFIKSMS